MASRNGKVKVLKLNFAHKPHTERNSLHPKPWVTVLVILAWPAKNHGRECIWNAQGSTGKTTAGRNVTHAKSQAAMHANAVTQAGVEEDAVNTVKNNAEIPLVKACSYTVIRRRPEAFLNKCSHNIIRVLSSYS